MSRDVELPDRPVADEPRTPPEPRRQAPVRPFSQGHDTVEIRGYRYQISPAQCEALFEVGRFRTIALRDLTRHHYDGRTAEMRSDLASFRAQGLLQVRTIWAAGKARRGEKLAVVVLTKAGQEAVETKCPGSAQKLFSGFVKPGEVPHDSAIYRMYQLEAERIRQDGGRVTRIVLDYELKQKVYAPLAKAKARPPLEYAKRQAEIAAQNELKIVRGKILLPDLRIEYETDSGTRAHVDLELATDHYRGSHLRGKAEAGFKFYAPRESIGHLSSAFDPEFMAEIFAL